MAIDNILLRFTGDASGVLCNLHKLEAGEVEAVMIHDKPWMNAKEARDIVLSAP